MTVLSDICHQVRSKNAGPFWITIDFFFKDHETFLRFVGGSALSAVVVAERLYIDPWNMKRFVVPSLDVLKFSYPRLASQGGELERDMHSGQQYVRLLDLPVG